MGSSPGQGPVEYVIALILVAIAILFAVRFFGNAVKSKYDCAKVKVAAMDGGAVPPECRASAGGPAPRPRDDAPPPPPATPDSDCEERLDALRQQMEYELSKGNQAQYEALLSQYETLAAECAAA